MRAFLALADLVAVAVTWLPLLVLAGDGDGGMRVLAVAACTTLATIALIAANHLYRPQRYGTPATELSQLWRVTLLCAALDVIAVQIADLRPRPAVLLVPVAVLLVTLPAERAGWRAWLRSRRRRGRYCEGVLLVGDGEQAEELERFLAERPALGLRVCATVEHPGRPNGNGASGNGHGSSWIGDATALQREARRVGASGAVVVGCAFTSSELNDIVRRLQRAGLAVQLASGLRGVDYRRVLSVGLDRESFLSVEAAHLTRWQALVKRAIDVVLAALLLALALPVLAVAALLIHREDGGSILYGQRRVGRGGRLFKMYKLRTMVPDADALQAELRERNERTGGPLFKLADDPRITRIGRVLRATSIDELPQLLNVLRGDMSLVGPRPALPEEVAQFDADLQGRQTVTPGITGLWQVEARDLPSFEAYRRLDLFYVENWSLLLDLTILASTVWAVASRSRIGLSRRAHGEGARGTAPVPHGPRLAPPTSTSLTAAPVSVSADSGFGGTVRRRHLGGGS